MTYILILSLLFLLCWLIFGQGYFVHALACIPVGVFIYSENYIYASIMALLMLFFLNTDSPEPIRKKQPRLNSLFCAVAIASLPIGIYFSQKKEAYLENSHSIFLSIILCLLVVFVLASSAIGVGMNRTKGDKKTYE